MPEKKEILCIHYYYPPIRSGGVLRNYYFSKEFAKFFSKVHVITTSNVDVMEQESMDIPDNVIIYKARTKDFRSIKRHKNHQAEALKKNRIVQVLVKLKKTLPFQFWIGEGGQHYIRNARKIGLEIMDAHPITHVYSSFMPYSDHKIASTLAKKNKELKWIADFRDLQIEPIYNNVYFPKWNMRQERKILAHAKLVTTVSDGLAQSMGYLNFKVLSVPRGIELLAEARKKEKKFTISYTGNLFQHYRDGAFFVKVFCEFIRENQLESKVQFIYAGRDSNTWKTWFENENSIEILVDRAFVSRNKAREIQQSSDALLLLSSSSENHQGVLTGKLFEYLETKKPILNFINGVKDVEFENLFDVLQGGYIFYPGDETLLKKRLETMFAMFSKKEEFILSKDALDNRKKLTWNARVKTILNACI